jgi:GDPmannose 4,6-dehydratase
MKKSLIFGVTGQDGSYLSEILIAKGYEVHGVIRRSSSLNTQRVDHIYQDPHEKKRNFILHYGDITDSTSVSKIIKKTNPDEIYNLAAQSHVAVSFEVPEYTANADALGALRILESIKFYNSNKKIKKPKLIHLAIKLRKKNTIF